MKNENGEKILSEQDKKVAVLMKLAANSGNDFPKCLMTDWLEFLEPYPADVVNMAAQEVMQTYEYKTIPPFAVLKKALDKICGKVESEVDLKQQAEAEWTKLLDDLSIRGIYRGEPDDMHPTTAYVLRSMGGWSAACGWKDADLNWRHREFVEQWQLCHEHTEAMELGANAVALQNSGMQSAGDILADMLPEKPRRVELCS